MPKLLRLTTDDDQCNFDNTFKEDIQIKPNSKIALMNFSCEINSKALIINESNNTIIYSMRSGDANKKEVKLTSGIYYNSNVDNLFEDMTIKLNSGLLAEGAEYGKQFLVSRKDSKFNIQTRIGKRSDYVDDQKRKNITILNTSFVKVLNEGVVRGDYKSFMYLNKAICKGSGSVSCQMDHKPNATGNGFIIGLTSTPITNDQQEIKLSQINIGILCNRKGTETEAKAYAIKDGIVSDTGKDVIFFSNLSSNNGTLYVMIEDGKLKVRLYGSLSSPFLSLADDIEYDGTTDLYPVLILIGDNESDNVRVGKFKFTPDPYYVDTSEINVLDAVPGPPPPSTAASTHYFEIVDIELAQALGFRERILVNNEKITNFDISGDFEFSLSDISESFYVELLNLPLVSYNADRKGRQNILHTIVNSDVIEDRVTYTAPYILWIDMNNSKPITLRNIRARILKDNGTPVLVNGKTQMTILID